MITAITIVIGIYLLIWALPPLLKVKEAYTPLKKEPTLSMEEKIKRRRKKRKIKEYENIRTDI